MLKKLIVLEKLTPWEFMLLGNSGSHAESMVNKPVSLAWWQQYVDVAFLVGAGVIAIAISGFVPRIGTRIVVTGVGVGLVGTGVWFLLKRE